MSIPPPSRGQKHAAGTNGSSAGTTTKPKKKPALPVETVRILTNESVGSDKGHIINAPSPIYKPYISPGVRGVPGKTLYVGNMSPDKVSQPHNDYRFIFHWNPSEIDIDTSTSYAASVAPKATYQDNARNLFVTTTSYSFQIMLERQEETYLGTKLSRPTLLQYGSNTFNGIKARTFSEIGTLYDLEFIYLVINGPQKQSALTPQSAPAISAPYILANPVYVTFGKSSQFYGYVTDLSINHVMFTPNMVPIVSYVQLTFNAYALKDVYKDATTRRQIRKQAIKTAENSGSTQIHVPLG